MKKKTSEKKFITDFEALEKKYDKILKELKIISEKAERMIENGNTLYHEDEKDGFIIKPNFKKLPKIMDRLEDIMSLQWYL